MNTVVYDLMELFRTKTDISMNYEILPKLCEHFLYEPLTDENVLKITYSVEHALICLQKEGIQFVALPEWYVDFDKGGVTLKDIIYRRF